jgi:hypothetical protein
MAAHAGKLAKASDDGILRQAPHGQKYQHHQCGVPLLQGHTLRLGDERHSIRGVSLLRPLNHVDAVAYFHCITHACFSALFVCLFVFRFLHPRASSVPRALLAVSKQREVHFVDLQRLSFGHGCSPLCVVVVLKLRTPQRIYRIKPYVASVAPFPSRHLEICSMKLS